MDAYCNSTTMDMETCLADTSCYWGPWENYTCASENDISCEAIPYEDPSCFVGLYENTLYLEYGGQNLYHFVEITIDSSGQMWWNNDAGNSWTLFYNNGLLTTGTDCPYDYQELEVDSEGTLWFYYEPYYPVSSHSNDDVDETGCKDSNAGHTDSYGDGCEWYNYVPSDCGFYDTDYFFSNEMCCACEGGSTDEEQEEEEEEEVVVFDDIECYDTDNGDTDIYGDGC